VSGRLEWVGYGIFAAFLVAGGWLGDAYVRQVIFRATDSVVLAASWSLAARAGLVSLGHSAFWGIGAYSALLVARFFAVGLASVDPFLAVLLGTMIAGVVASTVGLLVAAVTARMRLFYFAIATLAISELFRVLAIGLSGVTGGSAGAFLPSRFFEASSGVFWLSVVLAMASVLVLVIIQRSRLGYALSLLGQDEMIAVMVGIRPLFVRTVTLGLSAAFVGMKGAAYAFQSGYLAPEVAFDPLVSVQAQIVALTGGIGSAWGPVAGSLLLVPLSEVIRQALSGRGLSLFVYGLILVFVVLVAPGGIAGALQRQLVGRRILR
jgi:branched-chain amino acid transport system permease protein